MFKMQLKTNLKFYLMLLISVSLIFWQYSVNAQLTKKDGLESVTLSTSQKYKQDLQELANRIKAEHPRPFRFITEKTFDDLVISKKVQMTDQTDIKVFLWAFSEIISSIQCGHSRLPYFNQENELVRNEERFPLDVRFVGDHLYILDPLNNHDLVKKGDEIVKINGRDVTEIRDEIFQHIQAEGVAKHFKYHAFNNYANSYLTYALNFAMNHTITLANNKQPIHLNSIHEFKFKPLIHPKNPCQEKLCYAVDKSSNVGIMTIHTFDYYGENSIIFTDFIDSSLKDIIDNDRSAMVIDIRSHDGGSGNASAYLLRHLAKKPFKYFAGITDKRASESLLIQQTPIDSNFNAPVYLIVDGNTVSSAVHFAALFKEHEMGVIVGEPMGGNKLTSDGTQLFRSNHFKITYEVARMQFEVVANKQDVNQAVQPDIELFYSINDILNGDDSMMRFILNHIKKTLHTQP